MTHNAYRGINAHLHSYLQHEDGGWKVFHNKHISDLAELLDRQLPPSYEVSLTKSLQLATYHPDTGERIRRPEPDVTIYQRQPSAPIPLSSGAQPTATLAIAETIEDDAEYLTALIIQQRITDGDPIPVTRLELLSPTNKIAGDGYLQYREKRRLSIQQGIPLIEIDYLHESRFPLRHIPSYPDRHPDAYPYLIALTDPRPTPEQGIIQLYGFSVDTPIPTITIPLAGADQLPFDFDHAYQRTFDSLSYFRNRADLRQLPINSASYHPDDLARIRRVMEHSQKGL